MRVQYYKQYFTGPEAPGSHQPRKLVWALADRGHQVDVIACDVNVYNEQSEPEEHHTLASGGLVRVHRVPGHRDMRRGLGARLRSYLSFVAPAYRMGRSLPRPDVVVASVQPLFAAWSARRVARLQKAPWLLEVRDLWPDALEAKGAISSAQAWPMHRLAESLYRSADRVVSLTPGIKRELVKKGLPADSIDVFPNGFDSELFRLPSNARERTRLELGWGDACVALFAGAHTEVTAVETIVRAAALLRDRTDIRFELFGYGQTKSGLQALAAELVLPNLSFHDPVPKTQIPSLIAAADVCLMTLFESPLIHIYFENKLMDYMGAGKPILAAMGGMQASVLERSGAGRVVPAFDHQGLARLVAEAVEDSNSLVEMGQHGRRFVEQHLLLSDILERYVEVIEAVGTRRVNSISAWEPPI